MRWTLPSHFSRRWAAGLLLGLAAMGLLTAPLPGVDAAPGSHHITVTADNYSFSPGAIRVNPGDRVTLELVSLDVVHGLYLDGYELELVAEPGQPARLAFTADRAGTFRMRCSVTCGAPHPFMIGKLQVGPNNLFWRGAGLALVGAIVGLGLAAGRREADGRL